MNWFKKVLPVTVLAVVALASGCGQDARPESPVLGPIMPVAVEEHDATCFMPLSPESREQLTPYVTQQPGTGQSVCVMEPESDGEYEQQYYNEGDNFPDFWYYALLTRTAKTPTFSTGVIAEPSVVERITLGHVVYMNKYGSPYTAYEVDSRTGRWSARKADKPVKVKHVRYGAAAPLPLNTAPKPAPAPQNYKPQAPPASQGSGTVGRPAENRKPAPVQQASSKSSTSKSSTSSSSSSKSGKK